jgi:hypothetical protein
MVSFIVAFLKKRFGGSAWTTMLGTRMTRYNESTCSFRDMITKRVLGGQGSASVARDLRAELSRMIFKQPVCKYTSSLQVI